MRQGTRQALREFSLLKKTNKEIELRCVVKKWLQEWVLDGRLKSSGETRGRRSRKALRRRLSDTWRDDVTKDEYLSKGTRWKSPKTRSRWALGRLFCAAGIRELPGRWWRVEVRGRQRTLWIWLVLFQGVEQVGCCLLKALYSTDHVCQNSGFTWILNLPGTRMLWVRHLLRAVVYSLQNW